MSRSISLKVFYTNIKELIKILFTKEVIWYNIACNVDDCNIDEGTKIYKPHFIYHSTIGYGTYISTNAKVSYTTIGRFCSIGPNFISGFGVHPLHGISTSPAFYSNRKQNGFTFSDYNKFDERKSITIGNDVFIGLNVTILDGVTIGDGAVIGAGAIVSKDIPPYAVAVGSPIQIIKYRFDNEKIEKLLASKWWMGNSQTLKKVEQYFFDVDGFLNSDDD